MKNQEIPFNINNSIKVKLNDKGYKILLDRYNDLAKRVPSMDARTISYYKESADEDGYTVFQMWNFMSIFGKHSTLGSIMAYDSQILICT